ncbi:MAG: bifunctional glycosyltransferase/CDP-glycerol:glycerophosphate glycerophosphotransferase, partial [Sciscionella sp.]
MIMIPGAQPRFSLVSAVYNVGRYLPEFIASVEGQTHGLDGVEVIMVDDGSTDHSPEVLAAWAHRCPDTVRVVRQENAGQGAARNAGVREARGEWITFPDPDDMLTPRYLEVVASFLDEHPKADLVATHRLVWHETTGRVEDRHPLRFMFRGDPYVDLSRTPERFHGHSPTTFFRLDNIHDLRLEFDQRIRPNFEDGHFNCRYLLAHQAPHVAFLGSARYHYRERADGTSTLQTSRRQTSRYTAVPELGYLDVVRQAIQAHDKVPLWLAAFLIYELQWYFNVTDSRAKEGRPIGDAVSERFHELIERIVLQVDVEAALPYAPPSLPLVARLAIAHGYRPEPWHDPFVQLRGLDTHQELVRASYFFTGSRPHETWLANGLEIEPLHSKVRNLDFYGRTLLRERIVWLPANRALQAELGGAPADLVYERPHGPVKVAPPGQIRWWLNPESQHAHDAVPQELRIRAPQSRRGRLAARLWHRPPARHKYADAWVLMDRVHDANDSGEILFRHLRKHHPDINAWFVLEKGGAEWNRFKAEGNGDRLVSYGSLQWRLLMANAKHLLSSHADAAIVAPRQIFEFTHKKWRFHFLQHGVIKDDISSWLNPKDIDTFVTSTRQEFASVAGDNTPYVFTTREVSMTGLPRFDRLREVGQRFPPEKRDLLLVAPTWRNNLVPKVIPGTQRRIATPELLETDFIKTWLAYLGDPRLAAACRERGVTLGFLPHPNLQPWIPLMDLPTHVEPLSYEGQD